MSVGRLPVRELFIVGTDTGVGKTFIGGAVAAALGERGWRVGVMKPVESGCVTVDGALLPADAAHLRAAAGCSAPLSVVCPYALAEPIAPALAAERAGVRIELARIRRCLVQLRAEHEVLLVEAAGGLLTPLTGRLTMRDLGVALGLPVLVVARNVLGAINHTALTVEAARSAGLEVVGVVLNGVEPAEGLAAETNPAALRRWGGAPLLATVPHVPTPDRAAMAAVGEAVLAALELETGDQRIMSGPPADVAAEGRTGSGVEGAPSNAPSVPSTEAEREPSATQRAAHRLSGG